MSSIFHYARSATLLFLLLLIGALAPVQARDGIERLDWQRFAIPQYGTTVLYPARIFAPVGEAETGVGQRFESSNGRASLSIYSRDNSAGETPIAYLKNNMRVARAGLDYERVTRSFFAISMERDGLIYYSRCNFSRGRVGAIHCFDLSYPQKEERAWDSVVTRISLSLRPLER
jgi:hypothetical protein